MLGLLMKFGGMALRSKATQAAVHSPMLQVGVAALAVLLAFWWNGSSAKSEGFEKGRGEVVAAVNRARAEGQQKLQEAEERVAALAEAREAENDVLRAERDALERQIRAAAQTAEPQPCACTDVPVPRQLRRNN